MVRKKGFGSEKLPKQANSETKVAKITALQAILVALITAIGSGVTVYLTTKAKYSQPQVEISRMPIQGQPVDFISKEELKVLLGQAKSQVQATGYILDAIDSRKLCTKVREGLTAEIVLVDPNGKAILQREEDAGTEGRTKAKLLTIIESYKANCGNLSERQFKLRLIDKYPALAVFVADGNLYAYPYPYKASGSDFPVLRFNNYAQNQLAKPFKAHLDSILDEANKGH